MKIYRGERLDSGQSKVAHQAMAAGAHNPVAGEGGFLQANGINLLLGALSGFHPGWR
jgi:hypothetical protein